MPALKPKDMQARRRHILDAAMRCFARDGYRGTSMRDICKEAEVSIGGLYVHFKAKEDMLFALAEQFRGDREEILGQVPEGQSAAATVGATLRAMTEDMGTARGAEAVHADVAMMGEALSIPVLKDVLVKTDLEHFAAFGKILQSGSFGSGVDAEGLSRVVTGALFGLIILGAYHDGFDRAGYIQTLAALIGSAEQKNPSKTTKESERDL